ncbi:MAG: Maf family protein [bacterium]
MSKNILYIASQSQSRKKLLEETGFTFTILDHKSDEESVNDNGDFYQYVLDIARHKMDCVIMPEHSEKTGETIFVLTADTLVRTKNSHQIFGKPCDVQHAKQMLRAYRAEPVEIVTGCCVEKKIWEDGTWKTQEIRQWTTVSYAELFIEEDDLDIFLEGAPHAMRAAGSAILEGFGQSFCKSVQGSYSSIIGLPMFEVRQALKELGFKF